MRGSDDLYRLSLDLEGAGVRVGAQSAKAIRKAAEEARRIAQSLAPVESGATRDSIRVKYLGSGGSGSMTALILATSRAATFQEYGTSVQRPQPYMAPAGDRVAPGLVRALEQIASGIL